MSELAFWTAADAAELDVLTHELARRYFEHREQCQACQGDCAKLQAWDEHLDVCPACRGDAPLTYGPPCERRAEFVAHGHTCPQCNPCPTLTAMVETVVEWRAGRVLRSKAEWLRRLEQEREAAA
jgi:hypothetical protein